MVDGGCDKVCCEDFYGKRENVCVIVRLCVLMPQNAFRQLPLLGIRAGVHPVDTDCRQRRSPPDNGPFYSPLPLGVPAPVNQPPQSHNDASETRASSANAYVPGIFFLVSMLGYIVSGAICALVPPVATTAFNDHEIPAQSQCVRVTRHTDYATVDISMGTPSKTLNLLLRLDMVNTGSAEANMRLFSTKVGESNTVSCTGTVCTDAMLLSTDGPSSPQKRVVAKFLYTNPTTESLTYGTAVTLNLDGELQLAMGYDYFLTATHFCWKHIGNSTDAHADAEADSNGDGAVPATFATGQLRTDASYLTLSKSMRESPVGQAQLQGACENTTAGGVGELALFPHEAAVEASWLGLSSSRVYETSPDGVDDRRSVVEVGTVCAASDTTYQRAYSLYQLDCLSAYTPCETYPTVPFRRVADNNIRLYIGGDGSNTAYVWTTPDSRLHTLPKLEDGASAMWLSVIKLGLMTLAAAVTWIRAAKATSSHDRLFMYCVRTARCHLGSDDKIDDTVVLEDAFIGFMALAARMAVSIWRIDSLGPDNQLRAPVAQLVGAVLSLCQWIVRYFILERKCEAPLTKLGGSTALIDATSAVLLGFSQPPLLVSSEGRFDPTARLLTALLITTMTLQRCLFATSCCGLLWATARHDADVITAKSLPESQNMRLMRSGKAQAPRAHFDPEYVPILLFASVAWVVQASVTGILLVDLFCVPLAYSMNRGAAGGWTELALASFFAITAASLPQMMRTAQRVAEDPIGKAEESK